VQMTDLNEKMGIKVSIPDPLKREIGPRRFGQYRKTGYSGRSRHDNRGPDRRQRYSDKKSYYGLRSRW